MGPVTRYTDYASWKAAVNALGAVLMVRSTGHYAAVLHGLKSIGEFNMDTRIGWLICQ